MEILLSLLILGVVVAVLRKLTHEEETKSNATYQQELRDSVALGTLAHLHRVGAQAAKDDPYCILLRSTEADFKLSPRKEGGNRISDEYPRDTPFDEQLRQYLYARLQPYPVVAVKNSDAMKSLATFTYADESWQAKVLADLAKAQFILAVPLWLSDGFRWELEQIISNDWRYKTFFVMPPAMEQKLNDRGLDSPTPLTDMTTDHIALQLFSSPYASHLYQIFRDFKERPEVIPKPYDALLHYLREPRSPLSLALDWQVACDELLDIGFKLGRYHPRGGLLLPAREGWHLDLLPWAQVDGELIANLVDTDFRKRTYAPTGSVTIAPSTPLSYGHSDEEVDKFNAEVGEFLPKYARHLSRFSGGQRFPHYPTRADDA